MQASGNCKGFALIEIMVIVAVLSVIAAIFVPRFLKHQTHKKQEECHKSLVSLVEAERSFFREYHDFSTDLEKLGWKPKENGLYEYHFLSLASSQKGSAGFVFECIGNIDQDPTLDRALIDQTGRIQQISDDARQ
jgi:competence protein ComGC